MNRRPLTDQNAFGFRSRKFVGGIDQMRTGGQCENGRHFAHVHQSQRVQVVEELGFAPVILVKSDPVEADAVTQGPLDLLDCDLPLGPVDDRVGDVGRLATVAPWPPSPL